MLPMISYSIPRTRPWIQVELSAKIPWTSAKYWPRAESEKIKNRIENDKREKTRRPSLSVAPRSDVEINQSAEAVRYLVVNELRIYVYLALPLACVRLCAPISNLKAPRVRRFNANAERSPSSSVISRADRFPYPVSRWVKCTLILSATLSPNFQIMISDVQFSGAGGNGKTPKTEERRRAHRKYNLSVFDLGKQFSGRILRLLYAIILQITITNTPKLANTRARPLARASDNASRTRGAERVRELRYMYLAAATRIIDDA